MRKGYWAAIVAIPLLLAILVWLVIAGRDVSSPEGASEEVTRRFAALFDEEHRKLGFDCRKIRYAARELAVNDLGELLKRTENVPLAKAITPTLVEKVSKVQGLAIQCEALYNIAVQGQVNDRELMRAPRGAIEGITKAKAVLVSGVGVDCDQRCEKGLMGLIEGARNEILKATE